MIHSADSKIPFTDLSEKIIPLFAQLLGAHLTDSTLKELTKDPKIFNALFDLAEKIYEKNEKQFCINTDIQQSLWMQILQHGRIAFTFNDPVIAHSVTEPNPNSISILAEPIYDLKDVQNDEPQQTAHALVEQVADFESLEQTTNDHFQDLEISDPVFNERTLNTDSSYPETFKKDDDSLRLDQCNPDLIESVDPETTLNIQRIESEIHAQIDPEIIKASNDTNTINVANIVPQPPATPSPVIKKMPHFQIPNARIDVPYQAQIKIQNSPQQQVEIKAESVKFSSPVGIDFDEETAQFIGTPTVAGDYQISFLYRDQKEWRSAQCAFIINADPRSLWQVNEPNADEPYPKAHTTQQLIRNDFFDLVAASRRGRSHEHAGTFRDDDYFIQQVTESGWSVLVVADGAGSASFSRQGAKIAVDCAGQLLTDYIQQNQIHLDEKLADWQTNANDDLSNSAVQTVLYKEFHDVFYKVAQTSIQHIETEAQALSVGAKAFATTLLAAVVKQHGQQTFISTFWIGDGAIAVYSADKLRLMGTPDSGEFAGQTRFLDKSIVSNFNERVNIGYFADISAVILMTDGISDPRFETDAGLKNQQKWDSLWQELQSPLAAEHPDRALLEWMHFFSAGHHDDRTLAVLYPRTAIQKEQISPITLQIADPITDPVVNQTSNSTLESTQGLNDE